MAGPQNNFNINDYAAIKQARDEATQADEAVLRTVKTFRASIAPATASSADESSMKLGAPLNLSRRLIFPQTQLDSASLIDATRLYAQDQSVADTLTAIIDRADFDDQTLLKTAVREMLVESVLSSPSRELRYAC